MNSTDVDHRRKQGMIKILSCFERITNNLILMVPFNDERQISFDLELSPTNHYDILGFKNKGRLVVYDCYCVYVFSEPGGERDSLFSKYMSEDDIKKIREIPARLQISGKTIHNGETFLDKKNNEMNFFLGYANTYFLIPDVDVADSDKSWLSSVVTRVDDLHLNYRNTYIKDILDRVINHLRVLISSDIRNFFFRQAITKYFNEIFTSVLQLVSCDLNSNWNLIWDVFMVLKKKILLCSEELIRTSEIIPKPEKELQEVDQGNERTHANFKILVTKESLKKEFLWFAELFRVIGESVLTFYTFKSRGVSPEEHFCDRSSWIGIENLFARTKIVLVVLRNIGISMGIRGERDFINNSILVNRDLFRILHFIQDLLINKPD